MSPLMRVMTKGLSTGSRPNVMRIGLPVPAPGGSSSTVTGAFEAGSESYRFIVRNDENSWDQIVGDDLLRERPFKNAPVTVLLDPPGAGTGNPMRITFGREPVDKPFVMTLMSGDIAVNVRADGVGHFTVE